MRDRTYLYTAGLGIALIILYEAWKRSQAASGAAGIPAALAPSEASGAFPIGWECPMNIIYCANPSAYAPATAQSLTVNVACQTAAQLANRDMPLFGFVGIAQGTTWNP
jgi:hypothetical protein